MAVSFPGNTYAGKFALPVIQPLITEAIAIKRGWVKLYDAVNGKVVIPKADASITFADYATNFTDGSTFTGDEITIEPKAIQVQGLIPNSSFLLTWYADRVAAGLPLGNPTDITDAWVDVMGKRIQSGLESLQFNGKSTTVQGVTFGFSGTYTGYVPDAIANAPAGQNIQAGTSLALTGIANSGAVVTVGSTTGLMNGDFVTIDASTNGNQQYNGSSIDDQTFRVKVLSSTTFALLDPVSNSAINLTGSTAATSGAVRYINYTNVQNAIVSGLGTLPTRVSVHRDKLKVFVPDHIMTAYKVSQGEAKSFKAGYQVTREDGGFDRLIDNVYDYELCEVPNMAPNTILIALPDNLIWATALESNYNQFSIIDLYPNNHTKAWSYDCCFNVGGKIAYPDEVAVVRA